MTAVTAARIHSRAFRPLAPGRAVCLGDVRIREQLEFMRAIGTIRLRGPGKAAEAACDFYLTHATAATHSYWTRARRNCIGWRTGNRARDPFNAHEPVDSSAAAIAPGLLRLGTIRKQTLLQAD